MKKVSCVFVIVSMILASDDISVIFNEGAIKSFAASPNPGKVDLSVGILNTKSMNPYVDFDYYGNHGVGVKFQSSFEENPSFLVGFYYIWNDIRTGVDYNKYLFSIQEVKTSSGIKYQDDGDSLTTDLVGFLDNSMDIIISSNLCLSNQLYIGSDLFNFASAIIYNVTSLISTGIQFDYKIQYVDTKKSMFLKPIVGYSILNNQSFGYLKFDKINLFGSYSLNLKTDTGNKENTFELGFSIFFK
ncbi:MAG: hypothetical protein HOA66_03810 [Candidatus Marinimicrobia bacterium]|jgi:hypothetical protein|nr:hypothetical protein [Candidatus Neomarinimicrobiota bacterium]